MWAWVLSIAGGLLAAVLAGGTFGVTTTTLLCMAAEHGELIPGDPPTEVFAVSLSDLSLDNTGCLVSFLWPLVEVAFGIVGGILIFRYFKNQRYRSIHPPEAV